MISTDIIVQTLFVYGFVGSVMYLASRAGCRNNKWEYVVFGLFVYALIFGLRYEVGRDYIGYLEVFREYSNGIATDRTYESGYDLLVRAIVALGLPQWMFFGILAFLQVYFVFKAFKDERYIWPYLSLIFILNCEWLSYANVIRQSMAFGFFAYSLTLAKKKKIFLHYLFIVLAFSMHASAIVLLAVYPLSRINKQIFNKTSIELVLFMAAVVLGHIGFIQYIMQYVEQLLASTRYYSYLYSAYAEQIDREVSFGIGSVIAIFINFMIIVTSNRVKEFCNSDKINFMYDLFFVGTLLFYTFISSRIIQRMSLFFYGFAFAMGAFTLYYFKKKNKNLLFITLLALYCLIFVGYMYKMGSNDVAFRFIWQK